MAEMKRKTLQFSTGKQIKLFGNSIGIAKSLEVGEGYSPNILSSNAEFSMEENLNTVNNPYKLSQEEVFELADYMMELWLQLKHSIRKNGLDNPKLFAKENNK